MHPRVRRPLPGSRQTGKYLAPKGKTMKKLYFSYTTCPACAKVYGKNYVVLFAKV